MTERIFLKPLSSLMLVFGLLLTACKQEIPHTEQLSLSNNQEVSGGIQVTWPSLPSGEPLPNMESPDAQAPEIVGAPANALVGILPAAPANSVASPSSSTMAAPTANSDEATVAAVPREIKLKLVAHQGVRYAINLKLKFNSVLNLCLMDSMFAEPSFTLSFSGQCSEGRSTTLDQITGFEIVASRDNWKTRQSMLVAFKSDQQNYVFDFVPFYGYAFGVKGPLKNRSASVHLDVSSKHHDAVGAIYVLAVVPVGKTTVAYALDHRNVWVLMKADAPTPARIQGNLPQNLDTAILDKSDVSDLVGAQIIVGYGLGDAAPYQEMLNANRALVVYKIAP